MSKTKMNKDSCKPGSGCCSPKSKVNTRRDFIKKTALGASAFGLSGLPVFAGPFTLDENGHLVPEDKKLSKEWIKSLYERGKPEVFSADKEELKYIGMPVGGVACGQLYLSGDGRLWLWHIFKTEYGREKDHGQQFSAMTLGGHYENPDQVFTRETRPVLQGSAIRVSQKGKTIVRTLDKDGFDHIEFRGEYPIGKVKFLDAKLPMEIHLEACSPFIPLNAEDSALPATIMTYKVRNTSDETMSIELAGFLENAVCPYSNVREMGLRRNTLIRDKNRLTVFGTAEGLSESDQVEKEDVVFEDFESGSYKRWESKGTAFGDSPIRSGEEGYFEKRQEGNHYASSGAARELKDRSNKSTYNWGRILPGDAYMGTLTSKTFTITHDYISFLMAGGYHPKKTGLNLIVGGKQVISVTSSNTIRFEECFIDVRNFKGKKAKLELVDQAQGSWANIAVDHIVFTDKQPQFNSLEEQHGIGSMSISLINPSENSKAILNLNEDIDATSIFNSKTSNQQTATKPLDKPLIGAVIEKLDLDAGEEAEVSFLISWFFPDLTRQESETGSLLQLKDIKYLRKHYANRFSSANQVSDYIARDFNRLSRLTKTWNKTYYDSTLPYWLLDRSFISLDALATNTMLWFDNGRIYGWEGVECCPGTCQHVWQYAQGMARIFPEMERTLREVTDFGHSFRQDGGFGHRDETAGRYGGTVAHDGHSGTVMRVYREHKLTTDNVFLKKHYDKIKKSVRFLMNEDQDKDGLLEGEQHNTLDAAWYGPMGWISSLYIGAMAAGREMALEVGDLEFAEECSELIEKGRENLVSRLYNGEYFIHEVDTSHPKAINSNDGCHIDQVLGQSFASQYGIKSRIVPKNECDSALASIWKYNFTPDAYLYQQQHKPIKGARIYATQGEAGTIMCTWPKSDGDKTAVPGMEDRDANSEVWLGPGAYFDEAMNGFEYQVATHMIWEGMLEKGLALCRSVHDRYHPLMRNPYNEIECSDHYSRSMASYGVLLAVCGFDYHGPKRSITFAPKLNPENFKAPFTAAQGWGSFTQKINEGNQECLIKLKYGYIDLVEVNLKSGLETIAGIKVFYNEKELNAEHLIDGNDVRIKFYDLSMNENDHLLIELS